MPCSHRRDILKTVGAVAVGRRLQSDTQQNSTETPPADERPSSPTDGRAIFRVVHAAPDAPDIDVYFDDQKNVSDMNFGDVSPYFVVGPGQYRLRVTAEDDQEQGLGSRDITATAGTVTTAIVYSGTTGTQSTVSVDLLEDDLGRPADGTASVRLFHAVQNLPSITVRVTDTLDDRTNTAAPVFEPLGFGEAATAELSSGMQTLGVVATGTQRSTANGTAEQQEILAQRELLLQNGGVYSLFAIGSYTQTTVVPDEEFEVIVVEDAVDGTRSNGARQ